MILYCVNWGGYMILYSDDYIITIKKIITDKFGEDDYINFMNEYGGVIDIYPIIEFFSYTDEYKEVSSIEEFKDFIDREIFINIQSENKYDNNMPLHFKKNYPSLFLPEDTPKEIKDNFYNGKYSVYDLCRDKSLLLYFYDVCFLYKMGIGQKLYQVLYDLLNVEDFIELFRLIGSELSYEEKVISYIESISSSNKITLSEFKEKIFEYYEKIDNSIKYLFILKKLNYCNEKIKVYMSYVDRILEYSPEIDIRKIDNNIINIIDKYGYDLTFDFLEYNSGVMEIINNTLNDDVMFCWINYIKKLPMYNKKILHYAILSYDNSRSLIKQLITSNKVLTMEEINTLYRILYFKNEYGFDDINCLSDYFQYRYKALCEQINIDMDIRIVKDRILRVLFNKSLKDVENFLKMFCLKYKPYVELLVEMQVLFQDEEKGLTILEDILQEDNKINLINKFRSIFKEGFCLDLVDLELRLKCYFNRLYSNYLFKDDGKDIEGICHTTIKGLENFNMLDVNGNEVKSLEDIPVVILDGINFYMIIHKIHNYNDALLSYKSRIISNPSLWNKLDGSSTISCSLISDNHLEYVGSNDEESELGNVLYYGFNCIEDNSIMMMGSNDIGVNHDYNSLDPICIGSNIFVIPEILQFFSYSSYNEIVLDRKSGFSSEFDYRIQPTCVICFNDIDDNAKRAAQYFRIPIYKINKEKYIDKINRMSYQLCNGNISTISNIDVRRMILMYRDGDIYENAISLLNLCDNYLEDGVIDIYQCINFLEEVRYIIICYLAYVINFTFVEEEYIFKVEQLCGDIITKINVLKNKDSNFKMRKREVRK